MNWYLKVLTNYAAFDGRARRKEFWYFTLFNALIIYALGFIDNVIAILNPEVGIGAGVGVWLLGMFYILAMFIPSMAVSVRRLHDTGHSGWLLLISLVPFFGWIVLLVFMIQDSNPGPNQYGENPKGELDKSPDTEIGNQKEIDEIKLTEYTKAANQGDAEAQYNLGVMYIHGKGVKQDCSKAVEWYAKAANQENVEAQYILGTMYADGSCVKQDSLKGAEWLTKAANHGHTEAQLSLDIMHANEQVLNRTIAKLYTGMQPTKDMRAHNTYQALCTSLEKALNQIEKKHQNGLEGLVTMVFKWGVTVIKS